MASVRTPAHPRSRGENELVIDQEKSFDGSSPLTRGKRMVTAYNTRTGGLIPAHAGKTVRRVGRVCIVGAHPRSRGENDVKTGSGLPVLGSSPLTRGKL